MGKSRATAERGRKRNKGEHKQMIVYATGGRAAYASVTCKGSKEAYLRGRGKDTVAGRLFREEGSYAVETTETRHEARVRLKNEGYELCGNFQRSGFEWVDEGASIYAIETETECYIGWTCLSVNNRLRAHSHTSGCTSKRLHNEGGKPRVIEHYCPGNWTREGMKQREHELVNQTPNCVNYLKNESKLIQD